MGENHKLKYFEHTKWFYEGQYAICSILTDDLCAVYAKNFESFDLPGVSEIRYFLLFIAMCSDYL